MRDEKACPHPLLLHRREVGFLHAAELALGDERGDLRIARRGVRRERVLGGDRAERDAHDRVGARGEHVHAAVADEPAVAFGAANVVREREAHAVALADPVRLHRLHALRPAGHLVETGQELVGVVGDPQVVHRDLALLDGRAGAPAVAVDHLLVREHGLVHRVPVDHAGLPVGDALLEHLEEEPLVPLVVRGVAGRELARPVDGPAHRLALPLHVGDVLVRPLGGGHAGLHRGVLGGQPERVPAHRHQHVVPVHPQVPVHHVVDRVVAHVPHVQVAGGVRQHRHAVELRPLRRLDGAIDVGGPPLALDGGFDLGGIERSHGLWSGVSQGRIRWLRPRVRTGDYTGARRAGARPSASSPRARR